MNAEYVILRMTRKALPEKVVRSLLKRGLFIKSGMETSNFEQAAARYKNALESAGVRLKGSRVMIFGFGGFLGTGAELLRQGAGYVYLHDRYAPLDERKNRCLSGRYGRYLHEKETGGIRPDEKFMKVLARPEEAGPVDIVLSSSVLEHVRDVGDAVRTLARLTSPGGTQVHFIDLRDHFFRYPFRMLCYSREVWEKFLNPGSNLNRLRLDDYLGIFRKYFRTVEYKILRADLDAFRRDRPEIKKEFITGDEQKDAAAEILVTATAPKGGF